VKPDLAGPGRPSWPGPGPVLVDLADVGQGPRGRWLAARSEPGTHIWRPPPVLVDLADAGCPFCAEVISGSWSATRQAGRQHPSRWRKRPP
jgi:hypothetical protein